MKSKSLNTGLFFRPLKKERSISMPKENRRVSRKEADRNQFKNKFLRHLSLVSIKLFSLLFSQAKNT